MVVGYELTKKRYRPGVWPAMQLKQLNELDNEEFEISAIENSSLERWQT